MCMPQIVPEFGVSINACGLAVRSAAAADQRKADAVPPDPAEPAEEPLDTVRRLLAEGVPKKEALARVAKERKVPKRELYNALLKD